MAYDSEGREIKLGDTVLLLGPDKDNQFRCGFNRQMRHLVETEFFIDGENAGRKTLTIRDDEERVSWQWPTERTLVVDKTPIAVTEDDLQLVFM